MTNVTSSLVPVVIGPEGRGRGYTVLASGGAVAPGNWAVDLPMILLEWAKLERLEPFSVCLPLDDGGAVVCRGRYFHRAELGPVAYVHAVYLDAGQLDQLEWQTEAVLQIIPPPATETTDFANAVLTLPNPVSRMDGDDPLSLAWTDRLVLVEEPVELDQVLTLCLRAIPSKALRARVRGWSTSAELPPRGGIDPLRQCQLVVARKEPERDAAHLRLSRVGADGTLTADRVQPPPAYLIWQAFHRLSSLEGINPDILGTQWRSAQLEDDPATLAGELARTASARLPVATMIALLREMAASSDLTLAEAGCEVLKDYLDAMSPQVSAADALAGFLRGLNASDQPHLPALLRASSGAALPTFDSADLERLLDLCVLIASGGQGRAEPSVLSAVIKIAQHAAKNSAPTDKAVASLLSLLEHWPDDSRHLLDSLMDIQVIDNLARTEKLMMMADISRRLFGECRTLLQRHSEDYAQALRVIQALIAMGGALGTGHG